MDAQDAGIAQRLVLATGLTGANRPHIFGKRCGTRSHTGSTTTGTARNLTDASLMFSLPFVLSTAAQHRS